MKRPLWLRTEVLRACKMRAKQVSTTNNFDLGSVGPRGREDRRLQLVAGRSASSCYSD